MTISKMWSPLAKDHATLGWSADGGVPLQPWDHFDILHLSRRSVHSGGKTKLVCPSSSFLLGSSGPDRQEQKNPSDGHKKSIQKRTKLNKVCGVFVVFKIPFESRWYGRVCFSEDTSNVGGQKKEHLLLQKTILFIFNTFILSRSHILSIFKSSCFTPDSRGGGSHY